MDAEQTSKNIFMYINTEQTSKNICISKRIMVKPF